MIGATADTITILRSPYLRLAKRLRPDGGADGYDRAKTLDGYTVALDGLDGIEALLRRLIGKPDCCIVRGELVDGPRATGIRRLLHMDQATGELPTLRDAPRSWLALDLEGVPRPASLPATDLRGCAEWAMGDFPTAIREASCVIAASANHGVKADIRLRAWFWLSRPIWGHEAKRWLADLPCDHSVFGAAQPIYTAGPVLAPGVADPVPERLLMLPGDDTVDVPPPEALAPPPHVVPERKAFSATTATGHHYVRGCLERAASRIANAAEGGRHALIVAESCRLARFVGPGLLTAGNLAGVVKAAARQAGKDDEAELEAAVQYGLSNPWLSGPMPEGV